VTNYRSPGGAPYRQCQVEIDGLLHPAIARHGTHPTSQGHFIFADFDVVSGLTGVGAHWLARENAFDAPALLQSVVEFLAVLVGGDTSLPPRWHTPVGLLAREWMQREFPFGNLNCGLAHSIPGPLALLSWVHANGMQVAGLQAAIERAAPWAGYKSM